MSKFKLSTKFKPQGDQPKAIKELTEGILRGDKFQTLLGVTGSGKTYTIASVIQNIGKPALVISHNKTLAAQLYGEFRSFFPENAVEYFISYYDYYQPEAYIPSTDTYIDKDFAINDEIDRLRLRATSSLLEREDVVVVASVSCIYGIGSPKDYQDLMVIVQKGEKVTRQDLLLKLVDIHYTRNDFDFQRGTFRVRGDVVEIFPAYEEIAVRIDMFGDEVEDISIINTLTGEIQGRKNKVVIYPAKHFVTTEPKLKEAIKNIRLEFKERLEELRTQGKLLEAQRLEQRTNYDIEMMLEVGYCSGIENYSRHLSGRQSGEPPAVLLDYFPKDFLLVIDESHVTLPQLRGMYNGDRARKETLVEYGFRLPSALDNRPLKFEELESKINQVIFVGATPGDYELEKCKGVVVEQIIRPTGLMDPEIEVRPTKNQIDDLINEIKLRTEKGDRVLVTTLTKKMSEDLTDYLDGLGIKVKYLHSEIDALERVDILRDLRLGEFDVLVGINLLREGLDLPEVSLVAILDADKEGFLRSEKSLMQTAGRAARNVVGKVIFYADKETDSMKKVISETNRRRKIQEEYNIEHNIIPTTIKKSIDDVLSSTVVADVYDQRIRSLENKAKVSEPKIEYLAQQIGVDELIKELTKEMKTAAKNLEFEKAAKLRDEIEKLKPRMNANRRE